MRIQHTPLPVAAFAKRRLNLAKHIQAEGGGVVVLCSGTEQYRNRDADYPFRSDSYFHYLTSFPEPDAALIMVVPDKKNALSNTRSILVCRPKHEEREIWDGFRYGPDAAAQTFGMNAAISSDDWHELLPQYLANQPAVYFLFEGDADVHSTIMQASETLRGQARKGINPPAKWLDLALLLDEMRLFKASDELQVMRTAGAIAAEGHVRAMQACKPGLNERHLDAELAYAFKTLGAQALAYNSIVASGAHACVLHYRQNNQVLRDGDLVLIDAGCELDGYASDITRTFPINGEFNKSQQALYEVVLAAQQAAFEACRPGLSFNAPHLAAVKVLCQGLIDLKIVRGTLEEVLAEERYKPFYMHRTSHWLGLDVHDCGSYRATSTQPAVNPEQAFRALQKGMVLTIEPGLYIRPAKGVPKSFHNIGIRIEDDVAITAKGCEVYTEAAPKTVAEVQACMRKAKQTMVAFYSQQSD